MNSIKKLLYKKKRANCTHSAQQLTVARARRGRAPAGRPNRPEAGEQAAAAQRG